MLVFLWSLAFYFCVIEEKVLKMHLRLDVNEILISNH